jgi:hypothetical protein
MTKIFLYSAMLFNFNYSIAQTVVLEQDLTKDTIQEIRGQNLKRYSHLFLGYGFVAGAPEAPNSAVNYFRSTDFNFGFRHKRKITGVYDLGVDLSYGMTSFNYDQNNAIFNIPNWNVNSEKINLNRIGLSLFNRINIGQRGNFIKNFFDFGAYGQFEFFTKHIFIIDNDPTNYYFKGNTRIAHRSLRYTSPLNYGLTARIGIRRYAVYANYRISDIFKLNYRFPEPPRFIVGLQIGLHG